MAIVYDRKKKPTGQSVTSTGTGGAGGTAGGGNGGGKPTTTSTGTQASQNPAVSGATGAPVYNGSKINYGKINGQQGITGGAGTPGRLPEGATIGSKPSVTIGSNGQMVSGYNGLQGLSAGTQAGLGNLMGGYQPGPNVTAAQQHLNEILAGKPGDFRYGRQDQMNSLLDTILGRDPYQSQYADQISGLQNEIDNRGPYAGAYDQQMADLQNRIAGRDPYESRWTPEMERLYAEIQNREPFKYDLNSDMLYQNMADQYQQMGRQAMMDATGNASAMTGGYGNSYAATAGNQAYQQYLTQLNSQIPELYDRAYQQYRDQGSDLMNQWSMAGSMDDRDYQRWQNEGQDLYNQLGMWQNADARDYQRFQDAGQDLYNRLNMWQNADDRDYGRYQDEGQNLMNQYGLMGQDYDRQYGQWQDVLNQWNNDRNFAQGQYQYENDFGAQQYQNQWNNLMNLAGMENSDYWNQTNLDNTNYWNQQNLDHDTAMALLGHKLDQDSTTTGALMGIMQQYIQNGQMPPEALLQQLGISPEYLQSLFPEKPAVTGPGKTDTDDDKDDDDDDKTPGFVQWVNGLIDASALPGLMNGKKPPKNPYLT